MIRNLIIKVTLDCNMSCKYCYVQRNREYTSAEKVMSDDVLETTILKVSQYLRENETSAEGFVFFWHGGEPLLAGKDFFLKSHTLQQKHMPKHVLVTNTIQTNGVLLNKEWIDVIKDIGYGICLSLDGPIEINDAWRQTKSGDGTYQSVIASIKTLQQLKVPLSVLSVITPEALPHGNKIYGHLRELGFTWMDFMYPFYSNIDNTLDQKIEPKLWGEFFKTVFDTWIAEGNPDVYIRMLHDLCMLNLNGKTTMCSSNSDCSYVVTLDPSGNVYVCDDLMSYADSLLGNICSDSLSDIHANKKLLRLSKISTLYGKQCLDCSYFTMCKGGCTLFRAVKTDDFRGKHFYCEAQKMIIDHVQQYFSSIAAC